MGKRRRRKKKEEEKDISINKRITTKIKAKIFRDMGTLLSLRQILSKEKKRSRKHSPKMDIFNIYLTDKVIEQDYEVVKSTVI